MRRRALRAALAATLSASLACGALAPEVRAQSSGIPGPPSAQRDRPGPVDVGRVIEDAVRWMVQNQNKDGSWGSHHSSRPIEVLASIPGSQEAFRIATTALGVIALQDARVTDPAASAAADRALDHLIAHHDVKRMSGMEHYNVWSFGYALQCFGERLLAEPEDPRAGAMRAASARLVEKLGAYQTLDGGWGYLSLDEVPTAQPSFTSMSFTTGTILVGIERAMRAGVRVPEKLRARAIEHLERSRLPDGSFLYGEYLKYRPRLEINEDKGSACRTPMCHYALELLGRPPAADAYEKSLENLLVRHTGFQRVALRRPIPHESWYGVSGYFYLYGHAYATYVLPKLSPEKQRALWPALVDAVMVCHQPDGSFWDYPLYSYHKPYGTAFALIALSRVPRAMLAAPAAPAATPR
jgi:hypothetical protein